MHALGPAGRAEAAVLLRLLLRAAAPLLQRLGAWLAQGILEDDPCSESPICCGEALCHILFTTCDLNHGSHSNLHGTRHVRMI